MTKISQVQRILEYISEHGSITQLEASQDLGVLRLPARISDIKKAGFPIVGEMVDVKNRHGETCRVKRYSLMDGDSV